MKNYTKICLNKLLNYPCTNVKAYSNKLHKSVFISFNNYESLRSQCISQDLVLGHDSFTDSSQLNLKFKNCFHIWVSNNQLKCSY